MGAVRALTLEPIIQLQSQWAAQLRRQLLLLITEGVTQFTLVAEGVQKVSPVFIVRGTDGKSKTVRYEPMNAMLLNEFIKEHRRVQKQEATIAQQREDFEAAIAEQRKDFEATVAELKQGIEAVTARLIEQATQLQKFNAQTEINQPTARLALRNP